MIWMALAFVLMFGLSNTRKLRALMWLAQIVLGDAIAMRAGKYIRRFFKKRALRVLTIPTRMRPWKRRKGVKYD